MAKKASTRKKAAAKSKRAAKAARKSAKTLRKRATPKAGKASGTDAKKAPAKAAKKAAKKVAKKAAKKAKAPRSRLTPAQLRSYRAMLLAKRRELVGDMTGIEAEALGADRQEVKGDISDHPADAGTDNFEQEFSLGLLESERVLLAEIDEALSRVEDRTYGICLGTGKPIGKARLKARPWAKYCIEYARMVEKGLVRPGERLVEDE